MPVTNRSSVQESRAAVLDLEIGANHPMKSWRRIQNRQTGAGQPRRGAALIEAAITLPILCVLVFSSIEVANVIYLRQSLNIAAYEAGTSVSKPGVDTVLAETRCNEVLNSRGIEEYTLSFDPAVTVDTPSGTQIEVEVSAPTASFSIGPLWLFRDSTITTRVYMVRL